MASKKRKRSSPQKRRKSTKRTPKQQLRHEKALSKKLGYSVTAARQKRERAASKKALETAKKLAPYVPELKSLSRKSRLTPAEKAKVKRYYDKVKHFRSTLHAIPKKQRKAFQGTQLARGVEAISLNNFSTDAKVEAISGGDIIIVSNGRTWLLWRLDKAIVRNKNGQFNEAAKKAFKAKFPVEIVAELAEKAFTELKVEAVALWITSGRADRTFRSIESFMRYLNSRIHNGKFKSDPDDKDSDPGDFILGLAIQLSEPPKPPKKGKKK